MDDKRRENEKELNELSHVIMDALSHSDEVLSTLADLKQRKIIDSSTLLGLAIKISDILEISGMAISQEEIGAQRLLAEAKGSPVQSVSGARVYIDGKELSPTETAFQEWSSERFDEKDWLKKTKIIW